MTLEISNNFVSRLDWTLWDEATSPQTWSKISLKLMAKVITDVVLKDGTDEAAFITDVTSNTEVDLKNRLPNTPTIVVLKVEESYLNTLKSHTSVLEVEVPPPTKPIVTYPSIPSKYTVTGKKVTGYEYPSDRSSVDGRNGLSLTHYYDTDLMVSDNLIGMDTEDDAFVCSKQSLIARLQ